MARRRRKVSVERRRSKSRRNPVKRVERFGKKGSRHSKIGGMYTRNRRVKVEVKSPKRKKSSGKPYTKARRRAAAEKGWRKRYAAGAKKSNRKRSNEVRNRRIRKGKNFYQPVGKEGARRQLRNTSNRKLHAVSPSQTFKADRNNPFKGGAASYAICAGTGLGTMLASNFLVSKIRAAKFATDSEYFKENPKALVVGIPAALGALGFFLTRAPKKGKPIIPCSGAIHYGLLGGFAASAVDGLMDHKLAGMLSKIPGIGQIFAKATGLLWDENKGEISEDADGKPILDLKADDPKAIGCVGCGMGAFTRKMPFGKRPGMGLFTSKMPFGKRPGMGDFQQGTPFGKRPGMGLGYEGDMSIDDGYFVYPSAGAEDAFARAEAGSAPTTGVEGAFANAEAQGEANPFGETFESPF